jgi:hypothetical protein
VKDDMSIQCVIIGGVEAVKEISPAELPFIRITYFIPAKSAATTAIHVGEFG